MQNLKSCQIYLLQLLLLPQIRVSKVSLLSIPTWWSLKCVCFSLVLFVPLAPSFSSPHSIFFLVGFDFSKSTSGSSSAFSGRTIRQFHHGRCAIIRTTRTRKNPRRLFYTCALSQTDPDNCQFFQWVEDENQVSNPSSVIRESMIVADLNLQIETLQKKM